MAEGMDVSRINMPSEMSYDQAPILDPERLLNQSLQIILPYR